MKLIAWNTQGDKWDALWQYQIAPDLANGTETLALTVESGWAPWVHDGDVQIDKVYWWGSDDRLTVQPPYGDIFDQGVDAARRGAVKPFWIPWAAHLEADRTNSRCSMGGAWLGKPAHFLDIQPWQDQWSGKLLSRSAIQLTISTPTGGFGQRVPLLQVTLIHLVSGWPQGARRQLDDLRTLIRQVSPPNFPWLIVGDFNINLTGVADAALGLPGGWRVLRTYQQTHEGGSELDYGVIYDPQDLLHNARVWRRPLWKTATNQSDHAVIYYDIPL